MAQHRVEGTQRCIIRHTHLRKLEENHGNRDHKLVLVKCEGLLEIKLQFQPTG
jgi:hypothetical protein